MAPHPTEDMITIVHDDVEGEAITNREAFEQEDGWKAKGWREKPVAPTASPPSTTSSAWSGTETATP